MYMPVIEGLIERRILVNYRIQPDVLGRVLPQPFRPQLVNGFGLGGICLIRLGQVRPKRLPAWLGIRSENAAHRIAVEWEQAGEKRTGVYVLRRDTDARLNAIAGGRIFPGRHHRANFVVQESDREYSVSVSDSSGELLALHGRLASQIPAHSVFDSLDHASAFFAAGALGYSPARLPGAYDALELRSHSWHVEPLEITEVRSSYFDDAGKFPDGSIQFDCALLMRNVAHSWHAHARLRCCAG